MSERNDQFKLKVIDRVTQYKKFGGLINQLVSIVTQNMCLMKKEMNLILNNLRLNIGVIFRNLDDHVVGKEMNEKSTIPKMLENFSKNYEEYESKDLVQVLRKIETKLKKMNSLLNFSKTQILYEKNLKIMHRAGPSGYGTSIPLDDISALGSSKNNFKL